MNYTHLPSLSAVFFISLVTCVSALSPAIASVSDEKSWRFKVYLDDREIGYHHFRLTRAGKEARVTSAAHFDVTFLKIPLFRYRHHNIEVWRNQCLHSIASSTDENGRLYSVEGSGGETEFQLAANSGKTTLPACVSTFAYWDKSFLKNRQLLNSQTGEFVDVEVEYLGENPLRMPDSSEPAHRYRLTTDKARIELWYSPDNQWLSLQSVTSSGRVLRYVIE